MNLYTYVENNPLIYSDPTGHWCEQTVSGKTYAHAGDCANPKDNEKYYTADYLHDGDRIVNANNETGTYYYVDGAHEDNTWTGFVFDGVVTAGEATLEKGAALGIKSLGRVLGISVGESTTKNVSQKLIFYGGRAGEEYLAKLIGASSKQLQVRFSTSMGARIADAYVDGVAYESKVGYVKYSQAAVTQILKDAELLETGDVKAVVWNFFESGSTGKIGADPRLLDLMSNNGIMYVFHK